MFSTARCVRQALAAAVGGIKPNEAQPQVWRRLLVPEDITLIKLSVVLQQAMGWLRGHLHEYIAGRRHYGIPDEDWLGAEPMIDERRCA